MALRWMQTSVGAESVRWMDEDLARQPGESCMAGTAMKGRSTELRHGSWRVEVRNRFDPD
jgi:hypothetical protein